MTKDDIEGRVRLLMVDAWGCDSASLGREKLLGRDLGVDSLDLVEIIMSIEEEFGVEIPDEVLDGRVDDHTVGDVFDVAIRYALPLAA